MGPVVGGVFAARYGVDVAVAVAAGVYVVCAALVSGIHRAGDVAHARRGAERNTVGELLGGVRTLREEPHPRLIVLLFASQTMVRGVLNVLLVVAAFELMDTGEAGVGWLNAALGAGGLLGGLTAVSLVRRRRLAGVFGGALVLWGAPIALSAPGPPTAGHSCAWVSWVSATRSSTSPASPSSSAASTSMSSDACSASSRSRSRQP